MMKVDEIAPRTVVSFLGIILLFVAFYLALGRVDTYLHNAAIDKCAEVSRFDRKDGLSTVTYPIDSFYKDCLNKKGL